MRYRSRWMAVTIAFGVFLSFIGIIRALVLEQLQAYELPTEKLIYSNLRPSSTSALTDRFGKVISYKSTEWVQIFKPLNEISADLAMFVVFNEDAKFYSHNGFDVEEIKNSIEENLEKGKVKRGASTITQQIAKNLFLDKERSWKRKLFEVPWTLRLEKDLSKKQLLELYLNIIEWGPGIKGAEAASRHFFDKSADELTLGQAMYLALIIPNPVRFDLLANSKYKNFLEKKKIWMINRLVDEKKFSIEEKNRYVEASFELSNPTLKGRRFALSHNASYTGNRSKIGKTHYRSFLEKNWASFKRSGGQVSTILDVEILDALAEVPLLDSDKKEDRFFLIKESNLIRAFRFLPKNKDLDQTQLLASYCEAPFTCEVSPTIDWKNLAP
jgi:monofunctional biosynthetic peptidoglycan transglycosylase